MINGCERLVAEAAGGCLLSRMLITAGAWGPARLRSRRNADDLGESWWHALTRGRHIDGLIEVRPWASWPDLPDEIEWEAAVRLDCLYVTRDYDAFGCLFGVMNYAGFRPVAADRGLPSDAADQTRRTFHDPDGRGLWPTWIGWQEIQQVDWSELAEHADGRLHRYERSDTGQRVLQGKASWSGKRLRPKGCSCRHQALRPMSGRTAASGPKAMSSSGRSG
jgi:hypothetical protein